MGEVGGRVDVEGQQRIAADARPTGRRRSPRRDGGGTSRARTRTGTACRSAGRRRWCRRRGDRARVSACPAGDQAGERMRRGRSPWATMTSVTPASRSSATLSLTAALSPTPGCHRTVAPCSVAHVGNVVVVARHVRRAARRRRRAPAPMSIGRDARGRRRRARPASRALASRECLDRHEDDGIHSAAS